MVTTTNEKRRLLPQSRPPVRSPLPRLQERIENYKKFQNGMNPMVKRIRRWSRSRWGCFPHRLLAWISRQAHCGEALDPSLGWRALGGVACGRWRGDPKSESQSIVENNRERYVWSLVLETIRSPNEIGSKWYFPTSQCFLFLPLSIDFNNIFPLHVCLLAS